MNEHLTPSGVRLRQRKAGQGPLNWLFLPGGPGIGSESLHELVDGLDLPGSAWMVDLPGDGSNRVAQSDPFARWPQVLLEALDVLSDCIYVGHSTGGMYLLSVPELEARLRGLVLISSAPDATWHPRYVTMTQAHPLPEFDAAAETFAKDGTLERLRELVVASAPWNFTSKGLEAGRDLLSRMPYNLDAVTWSDEHFDHVYAAKWWPASLPTLILGGAEDRIVDQRLWEDPRFRTPNITHTRIEGGGHFPWIDAPEPVRKAFASFSAGL